MLHFEIHISYTRIVVVETQGHRFGIARASLQRSAEKLTKEHIVDPYKHTCITLPYEPHCNYSVHRVIKSVEYNS